MKGAKTESIDGQADAINFFQHEEAFLGHVIIGCLKDGAQRNQSDNLRPHHGHFELTRIFARL